MPLMMKTNSSIRCLDCKAEVSVIVLKLMLSNLGRDKTYQCVIKTQPHENPNRPFQTVLTSNDQY